MALSLVYHPPIFSEMGNTVEVHGKCALWIDQSLVEYELELHIRSLESPDYCLLPHMDQNRDPMLCDRMLVILEALAKQMAKMHKTFAD